MINPESDVYRIETLQDIFDNVPKDRIDLCMKELALGLKMAREVQELHDMVGMSDHNVFPGYIEWVDDDEEQYEFTLSNKGDTLATVNLTVKETP